MKQTPRQVALVNLQQILNQGGYAHLVVPASLKKHKFTQVDKNLVVELTYGVIRHKLTLDWIISYYYKRSLKKLQPELLNLLRLGVYQIIYLKVPDYASVNESVDLAKKLISPGAGKLVNAVLRKVATNKNNLPWPDREDLPLYLSITYSHPLWLVNLWLKELGLEQTQALLAANNRRPQVTLRVNSLKITQHEIVQRLTKSKINFQNGRFFHEAIVINDGVPDELINKGLVYVQDEASMAVAKVLTPLPGQTVIDLCSGPGGKTTHIGQLMENKGLIYAVDLSEKRLNLVKENCQRLGVTIVKFMQGDATLPLKLPAVDRVLVDAPCSGLGVLSRRPDLRWRKTAEDIDKLAALQFKIMSAAVNYVKKQGILVYAVCTISQKETEGLVKQFLKAYPDFTLIKASLNGVSLDAAPWLQFLPHKHGTDGFFIAKFKKR